jgi:hypothetical protein
MFNVDWLILTLTVSLSNLNSLADSLSRSPVQSLALPNSHHHTLAIMGQSAVDQAAHPGYAASIRDATLEPSKATQRRPRRRLGGRSGICIVSPGLLERQNVIWSDRPLFLWQADPATIALQRLVLVDQDRKILWEKLLLPTDQWAIYDGQPLQPGQFYTWWLEWRVQDAVNRADYTFQVMPSEPRQRMGVGLDALTQQLQTAGVSPDAIASQQADYFLDQDDEYWSDALTVLYAVRNPSTETIQRRQDWVNSVCGEQGES